MSRLLEFETNIEQAVAQFFDNNNLIANISRGVVNLNDNNIQINFEYLGALEETRQHLAGHFEYNTHQGTLNIVVHTFRNNENLHNARLGQVRRLLLNHYNGLAVEHYKFIDILPQTSSTSELDESNVDSTQLLYLLRFEVDLNQI